ncbi:MAG: hypothetical protein V4710_14950 [Verrucomicrobiota bacterium]
MSSLKEVEEHQRDSAHRAEEFCREHQRSLCKGIDRLFLWLMALQWAACIALWGWNGAHYPSLWMVLLLGGAMAGWPAYHAFRSPGMMLTRQTMALGQMLLSSLLIHLSGSRPETHFHVFISFALLAFYRDWRVLVSASVVAIASPLLETGYQLLLGGVPKGPVDWAEYIGWILFLDTWRLWKRSTSVPNEANGRRSWKRKTPSMTAPGTILRLSSIAMG